MASSHVLAPLLVLALWFCPAHAQTWPGNCESELSCADDALDQDDTGLIQKVGNGVEVTKARGIVGNSNSIHSMAKEGSHVAAAAPLADISASGSSDPEEVEKASKAAPAKQAEPSAEVEKVETSLVEKSSESDQQSLIRESAVEAAPAISDERIRSDKSTPATRELEATALEPLDRGAEVGLSFFQLGEVENEKVDTKEEQNTEDQDWDEDLSDGAVPDEGQYNTGLGWTDSSAASLQAKLGQVLVLMVAITVMAALMLKWRGANRPRDALSTKMRKKLERMTLVTGPEIRSVCAMDGGDSTKPRPDAPMRIQGRVVSKSTGPLVAPISGRSCVLYSASVSQHRHDGVHQPPVAFDSSARDFAIQLEDCPEMFIEINSKDVFPFDMDAGRYACELAFTEAPDTWRGFTLGHLVPNVEACGAAGQSMNRVDLGAKGPLNFRECALVEGSRVTCIGEVVREYNGKLRLSPWSPALDPDAEEAVKSRKIAWLTPEAEPWRHKLMISDDAQLLLEAALPSSGKCRSCTGI